MALFTMNLLKRVGTAAVGAPIVIGLALWSNPIGWQIFIGVATFLALYEFSEMAFEKTDKFEKITTMIAGTTLAVLLMLITRLLNYYILIYPALALLTLSLLVFFPGDIKKTAANLGKIFLGIFFIGHLFAFIAMLKIFPYGGKWILFTLTIVWFGDTGAYFVGKSIGKHKLSPVVSPNKTWEGSFGGIIASLIAGYLATLYIPTLAIKVALPLAMVAGAFGQIGDLAESLLKRSYGVKDSGSIIPGHGGILDRIDSILFAAPLVFMYLWMSTVGSM
jgi:phosphatidate cytidylyltransferase